MTRLLHHPQTASQALADSHHHFWCVVIAAIVLWWQGRWANGGGEASLRDMLIATPIYLVSLCVLAIRWHEW